MPPRQNGSPPAVFSPSPSSVPAPISVAAALATVANWREGAVADHQRELMEVDTELDRLRAAIEDLQRQIAAVSQLREDVVDREARLTAEETQRSHEALFAALGKQAEGLEHRASVAATAESARRDELNSGLRQGPMGKTIVEYEAFDATASNMEALPATYRAAILGHHETNRKALLEHIATLEITPVTLADEVLKLDVVFTIDAPEGEPELVLMVIPVHEDIYSDWDARDDDAQTWLASRAIQGLYEAATFMGQPSAQAMCGEHRGLLAVELEIEGLSGKDVPHAIAAALDEVFAHSPELRTARIHAQARFVPVDYLLPPEPELAAEVRYVE